MILKILATTAVFTLGYAQSRTEGALSTQVSDTAVMAELKEGFHFNDKAPNGLVVGNEDLKPTKLEPRKIEFSTLPRDWQSAKATFYVCDDAVTFCETRTLQLSRSSSVAQITPPPAPPAPAPAVSEPVAGTPTVNTHGFLEGGYEQALAQAKKEKKLLLIDFSARWCPSCVRLEMEIFPTKQFKNLTKGFVKLKIDTDRFENSAVSEKFAVKGIPTLLVINAQEQEIDRMIDYQPLDVLSKFFASVKADPASLARLTARAKNKDQKVLLRLGKRLASAGRFKEAVEYLSQVAPPPPELLEAKVNAAGLESESGKEGKARYAEVLRKAIEAEPESLRSLNWRVELMGVTGDKEEKSDMKKEGLSIADDLIKDPEAIPDAAKGMMIGEFTGYEPFMVAIIRAELVEASGASPAEVATAWKKAAETARELKIPADKIGISMRRLNVLIQGWLYEEADKLTLAMLKSDPDNAELKRRRLRVLLEMKKYPEAIELGQDALAKSYGRNEFWVAESLAKALIEGKRSEEARQLLDRYLARAEISTAKMKDTKKKFEDLKAKASKG